MTEDPVEPWPPEGLEAVPACPVCGSSQRTIAYDHLRDRIFFCAPGEWSMARCSGCASLYLDPRPTLATIGRAYDTYYTHETVAAEPTERLGTVARWRRALANGYRNWRFGAGLQPSNPLGVALAWSVPSQRHLLDRQYRHLPKTPKGRVLDVGFGSGAFLADARAIGWEAVGTDIDPKVIAAARARGLDVVEGTVDEVDGPFDYITLSHTIEHFHDPCAVLARCFELLASGGAIWIETPNADAVGLKRYGADWRGLEPPRHLVLFNRRSIEDALQRAGFAGVRDFAQPEGIVRALHAMSENIRNRRDPAFPLEMTAEFRRGVALDRLAERRDPRSSEFIGVIAYKK